MGKRRVKDARAKRDLTVKEEFKIRRHPKGPFVAMNELEVLDTNWFRELKRQIRKIDANLWCLLFFSYYYYLYMLF